MIKYEELIQNNYVSSSVGELLFGKDNQTQNHTLQRPGTLPRTAYNVCLLYSALVQAYVINKAIQKKCTVFELGFPSRITDSLKQCWSTDDSYDLIRDYTIFSFLLDWAECNDTEIMGKDAAQAIKVVRDAHKLYISNSRVTKSLNDNDFLHFLQALPLLHTTQLDFSNQKIIFNNGIKKIETKCSPYISFWNSETETTVDRLTPDCYILASIEQGDRNGELCFNIAELNSYNINVRTKQIRRQVVNNENLLMICKTVGIKTDWYPIDDCWCDLAFLKRITIIAKKAVVEYWKKHGHRINDDNVIAEFRNLYKGSELYDKISTTKKVSINRIDVFLYELYINYGVFKSMRGLFLDDYDNKYSKELFELFMQLFVEENMITETSKQDYEVLCNNKISEQIFKLEKIVPKDSDHYNVRSREIKAEWRAFYVLQAAGISTDNLFANQEELLSIDDYYNMVDIPDSSLKDDLRNVLCLLTEFYGAMLINGLPFNERGFHKTIWQIKKQNKDKDVKELFDELIEIVKRLNDEHIPDRILGRQVICNPEIISKHANIIMSELDTLKELAPLFSEKRVFISYSHKDIDLVSACVSRWQKKGFHVFFDEEKFKSGDNWRVKAKREIESDSCEAVIVFMSRSAACSEEVRWELEQAQMSAKEKFGDDAERKNQYIIAVNLENIPITEYLIELDHTKCEETDCVYGIRKMMHSFKMYRNYFTDIGTGDENGILENELYTRLMVDNDNGVAVQNNKHTDIKDAIADFYSLLKYGDQFDKSKIVNDSLFNGYNNSNVSRANVSRCIFPMVISVKETKIKRDNITLAGYEFIKKNDSNDSEINYILSSKRLSTDEYYCIPNYRSAEDCSWMVEPFLVNHSLFITEYTEDD